MTILKKYILGLFGRALLLGTGAFIGLYLLVDFFEKVDTFIEHHARLSHYLLYFSWKLPLIVVQVIPLAVLMAVFLTLGALSRNSELTALRASGISVWQAAAPLVGLGLLISVLVLAAGETLVPFSARQTRGIFDHQVKGKAPLDLKQDRLWFREGNTIVNINLAVPDRALLQGITVYGLGEDFRLVTRTDAGRAIHTERGWVLDEGVRRHFDPASGDMVRIEPFRDMVLPLERTPADFQGATPENEELGFGELRRLIHRLQADGYDATRFRVDLQARLAGPFASLVMAFLGIPFALQRGRAAGLALGVAITVVIGIAYQMVHATLIAFGYSAVLPPIVAAWSANLLFGMLGIWLLLTTRE
jgi:lipopolysaccharide export system permease protein